MKINGIMSHPVITIGPEATVGDAAKMMLEHRIGCLPVVDSEGRLIGMLAETDFIAKEKGVPFSTLHAPRLLGMWLREGTESIYENAKTLRVVEIMRRNPRTLQDNDLVKTYLEMIIENGVSYVPVLRQRSLVGIVAPHDLLKMLAEETHSES